ncbi:SDR family NAD(P)-dependent oxidoreductase [Rhodohalobacter barkolensis]|uniref:SDR family oxidoreductase n=1 Tax=Rhodohalobacter barkolensis TaxID=2053187 RepID=A0A2N0VKK4_9BACT|nr:SDR family oxidoreductase [Rhodohalobacter barkolensis]PKD44689.1 SDR family oxidoreductase [Rhodohalobacter barkolensis]
MTYQESSILITGASQGIGRSISIAFAAATDRPLLLLARNLENLNETKQLCEQAGAKQVAVLACDATDEEAMKSLELPDGIAHPGTLINNAGSFLYKAVTDTTNSEFQNQIDINLFTAVNTVNRFLPTLREMDRSLIINICSVGSLRGLADSGAYASAKHALLGYTRSLRDELQITNVGVTAINLGQTHSTSWDESSMSPERLINPTDVAKILVTLASLSPRSLVEEIIIQPQHGRVEPM